MISCNRFSVDGTPIREFKNLETKGVPFPKNQAMRIYSSLWNAEEWATRGGLVKTDWSQAPFTASYRNFNAQACVWTSSRSSSCPSSSGQSLDATGLAKIRWVQKNYMIYNYCTDTRRFPQGFPPECSSAWEIENQCCCFLLVVHAYYANVTKTVIVYCFVLCWAHYCLWQKINSVQSLYSWQCIQYMCWNCKVLSLIKLLESWFKSLWSVASL